MPVLSLQELQEFSPVFRGRVGTAFAKAVLRFFEVEDINRLQDTYRELKGSDFTRKMLEVYRTEYQVGGVTKPESLAGKPFITISNHIYGGIDGIILVDYFQSVYPDYKVLVNKILMRISSLADNFIPVTPTGEERTTPTATSIAGIRRAMEHLRDGHPLGLFPAGAVSDLSLREGRIRDREWQDPIIRLIRKANVAVVPVRFFDRNTLFYYLLGLIDWRVRLLRLPHEVLNKGGKRIRMGIGAVISPEEIRSFKDLSALKKRLREAVYGMDLPQQWTYYPRIP